MAAKALEPTPMQHIQHHRFTTKQHGYQFWYLSLDLSGNIAVSGQRSSRRTYIDLYSGGNSVSRDKLKLLYSIEFEKKSNCWRRYVSFLDKNFSKLVTCIGDKIEIIDMKNEGKVLRSCRVNGKTITCLAVSEGEVFVGVEYSEILLVFNNDLEKKKTIRIKGIQDGDWPEDLQVIKDTIFVCTATCRGLSLSVYDRSIVSEYTDTTGMHSDAHSIAVSENINLVAVLWGNILGREKRIIVYSLNTNKSYLVFEVDNDVTRIRISHRDRMIITGNEKTGEIKMYDLEQLFSFEGMKKTLAYLVSPNECEKIRKYFGVTEEGTRMSETGDEDKSKKLSDKEKTIKKMKCILTVIEKNGHLNPNNINTLTDAMPILVDKSRISSLKGPMEGFSLHGVLKVKTKNLVTEMVTRQQTWEVERDHLSSKLEAAENKVKEYQKTLNDLKGDLVCVRKQTQEWGQTLRKDLKNAKQQIKGLEEETLAVTAELRQSSKQMEPLTEELMKYAKERKTLNQSKTESDRQIETLTQKLKQTKHSKTESDRQNETLTEELTQVRRRSSKRTETLTAELNETQQKLLTRTKELETTKRDLEKTKEALQQTTQDRDYTRAELKMYELDFAKESKALREVLNHAKEAMAEFHERLVEDRPLVDLEGTRDEGGAILAAKFGRLTVAIAEHLTLDHCLKLARIFDVPASDCNRVCRVSENESPGMKLLDVLKKRKVINRFDITNLQKALEVLHLEVANYNLVKPYQDKIDDEQYELNKLEEYTWKEIYGFTKAAKVDTARHPLKEGQVSLICGTQPENSLQSEATAQSSETEEQSRVSLSRDRHHHQLYTEHSIGRDGGTIQLANISLTVPPNALHENCVVALSVMNESPFPLDREVDTARMTPLIKLEPLGLTFKKSLQLNIPHSALISEPENHDVIIYSGQITKNNGDSSGSSITWTEEKAMPRKLKKKSVTVDIKCLTYLSASLVSQTSAPPLYIVRAVLFVNGVRNTDDDIILTICFCSDNDSEYNLLLSDYRKKLPLEHYSTLQLKRHSERDEHDARFLRVTVTSVNNTYVPDADQAMTKFTVSHLCTASRVCHQLRLQRNQDIDRDGVDIVLTFSQAETTSTRIFMKAKIKDLMISQESEDLLIGSLSTDYQPYEDLKANISAMLEYDHCRKIATYFGLTPAEEETLKKDAAPGRKLMKILDEREQIMPQKLFDLYQGLKVCHLDKIGRIVLKYIKKYSNETQQEIHKNEKDKCVKGISNHVSVSRGPLQTQQRTARSVLSDQSVQTTLSSSCLSSDLHVKTLTKEGFIEHKVIEALAITRNRIVLARKVLQVLGEKLDVSPTKNYIFLHKEQYIDENGGDIYLPEVNVHLRIPVGAVSTGNIISLTMMTSKQGNVPSDGGTPQLSPVIKVGPECSKLNKDVILRIPHCATQTEGITSADMCMGFSIDGEEFEWRKRKFHEPKPVLEGDHFKVSVQKLCVISLNVAVDFKKSLSKRFRVLPVISRIVNPTEDLTVILWIYNDDETEHMHLLHDEINVRGRIQLHDFKQFTLKGSEEDKEVHIESGSNKIISHANLNLRKVLSTTLWHNTRHAVEFHFQNKEGVRDISFRLGLCTKQGKRTVVDSTFDVRITLSELLQKPQKNISTFAHTQEPHPAMEKSFQKLVSKLSGQLDVDSCLEIASLFRLSFDLKDRVKKNSRPGKVLFGELIQHQLITAASVSALDVALTRTGNVHLAEEIKAYRHRNATFPTTVFTLL